jgi:hypothetical protein
MLRRKSSRKLTTMLIVALTGSGIALVAGMPARASTVAPVNGSPAVENCGTGTALTRPSSLILTCADGKMVASHLRWQSWNETAASATSTVTWLASATQEDRTTADITLSDPVRQAGGKALFTKLRMRVVGATPSGFMRDVTFSEAPVPLVPTSPAQVSPAQVSPRSLAPEAPAASSGTLGTAAIGGYWELAGGPPSVAETAEAITGAESSFLPGIIQPSEPYSTTGWGLWQITPGNSVPVFGEDFQLLDPWNNAEAAVSKYDAAGGFGPWTTWVDGAYESFLGDTNTPNTNLSDPGQYVSINSAPSGTNNSSAPGATFGPAIPGGGGTPPPAPLAFKAVFQANTNTLAGYSNSGSNFTTTLGMMPGTSPSVTTLSDGTFEAAFEANNDLLGLSHLGGGTLNTNEGMDSGTSPAIAALPSGRWIAAFQANNDHLVLYSSSQVATDTGLGMSPGTSPAIAVQSNGSYRVVFQANNHFLAGYNSSGSNFTSTAGMKAGTSPSIAAETDGTYEAAIQANTAALATLHIGTGISVNTTTLGMDPASSPAVAVASVGNFRVVFQANNHLLAGYSSSGSNFTSTAGMKAGTSPSFIAEPDGTYEAAIEANTDQLATLHFGGGYTTNPTNLGLADTTSPAITY